MRAPVPAPFAEVAGDATGEPPNQTSVSAADDATRALESMTLHPGPSPEGGYFENGDNTQGGEEHPSNGVPSFGNPYANDCDHGGVAYDAYGYQLPGYQVGAGGGYDGHELQNSGGYDGYDSQGAYSQGQGAYPAQGSTYPNTVHQSLYRGHPGNQLAMQQHPSFLYAQQQRQIAPDPAALYAYYRQAAELGDPTAQTALQRAFASMPVHGFGTVVGSSPETTHGAVSPGSSNGDAVAAAHAEALYRQMAHLQSSQMAHAQMWGGGGNGPMKRITPGGEWLVDNTYRLTIKATTKAIAAFTSRTRRPRRAAGGNLLRREAPGGDAKTVGPAGETALTASLVGTTLSLGSTATETATAGTAATDAETAGTRTTTTSRRPRWSSSGYTKTTASSLETSRGTSRNSPGTRFVFPNPNPPDCLPIVQSTLFAHTSPTRLTSSCFPTARVTVHSAKAGNRDKRRPRDRAGRNHPKLVFPGKGLSHLPHTASLIAHTRLTLSFLSQGR